MCLLVVNSYHTVTHLEKREKKLITVCVTDLD